MLVDLLVPSASESSLSSEASFLNNQIALYLIIFAIPIIGIIGLISKYKSSNKKFLFLDEFGRKLALFLEPGKSTTQVRNESYLWLSMNVDKAQAIVGSNGIIRYKPAFYNVLYNNYPLLTNTVMKIGSHQDEPEDITYSLNLILRQIGIQKDISDESRKHLFNPLFWVFEGVRVIIGFPVFLLEMFGLLKNNGYERFTESLLVRIFSFLVTLLGIIASLIQIFQGWDFVVNFVRGIFQI